MSELLEPQSTADVVETRHPGTLVVDPEPRVLYPHEAIDSIAGPNSGQEWIEVAKLIGQNVPLVLRSRHAPTADRQSMTFRFLNGDVGADILPKKQPFGELIDELGYHAPRTIYIESGSSVDQVKELAAADLSGEDSFFIKPVNGVLGRGTGRFDDLDTLASVVASSPEDYLVQSDETPVEDWRYILHRDTDSNDRVWRIAYKKVRPSVVGDGVSTVSELVNHSTDIPSDKKVRIIQKIGDRSAAVAPKGQEVAVAESGNISNGAYGQLPEQEELQRMDDFMKRFVADLEGKLGVKLNTMCFDLGVKDKSIFEDNYDFEKMRQSVVFYEFQIPFGITGYLDELYSREGRPIERVANLLKRTRLQFKLGRSALKNLHNVAASS